MNPVVLAKLALAGNRTGALRVALTALSTTLATLALLAAATVLAIRGGAPGDGSAGWSQQYRNQLLVEPGLRPGLALALILLAIPALALAGQCARLGGPARDRRMAAIRLAGATPAQSVAIAAAETGGASLLGAAAGFGAYVGIRALAGHPGTDGRLVLPTDVLPPWWALLAIGAGLPILAAGTAALLLRRVVVTPLAVVRRTRRTGAPRSWPGILISFGVAVLLGAVPVARLAAGAGGRGVELGTVLAFGAVALVALGVILGAGWLSHLAGRMLYRVARRPAALLAARRLVADPWATSRNFGVLLIAALFGAGAAGVRALIATTMAVQDEADRWWATASGQPWIRADHSFYFDSLRLVDIAVAVAAVLAAGGLLVAVAESVVSRRRTYASLRAAGVPRATLARSVLWQALVPTVPAIAVAAVAGALLPLGAQPRVTSGGYDSGICDAADRCVTMHLPEFSRAVPVPWADLAVVGGGALVAVLLAVAGGLLFLRAATDLDQVRAE